MESRILPPIIVLVVASAIAYPWYRSRRLPPAPPGPSGHWLFGNALEIAQAPAFHHKITEYAYQYGPLITIRMLHQYAFVVSDPQLVIELFEKRGANYSDRDENEMVKLTGWNTDLVLFQYGPRFKRYRAILNRATNIRAAQDYIPLQQHELKKLMKRLVEDPERFLDHIQLMAASIAIRIAYGYKVESFEDPFVKAAERHMQSFGDCTQPWNWMVNIFTPLRYLPDWLPIAPFQRKVQEVRDIIKTHREKPFAYVQEQMAAGLAEPSFVAKLLQPEDGSVVDEEMQEEIKSIAGTFYSGGADTIVSVIHSFFLAMTLHPEAQAKSQKEIDSYLLKQAEAGNPRTNLDPEDRSSLPYTSALVREVLRWHPVTPIIFHRSGLHDDNNVVSGGKVYRIPAQSLVVCNIWKLTHDPDVYVNPDLFIPERYLVENPPPNPENYAFGFGRRICPGIHIALHSTWISISNLLANFTITKSKDENGKEITPKELYDNTFVSHPVPFVCSITPRDRFHDLLQGDLE